MSKSNTPPAKAEASAGTTTPSNSEVDARTAQSSESGAAAGRGADAGGNARRAADAEASASHPAESGQSMYVDAVSRFLEEEGLTQPGRLAPLDARAAATMWQGCAGMGLPLACVPESQGGLGLPLRAAAAMLEETGRHLLPLPTADAVAINILLHRLPEADTDTLRHHLTPWLEGATVLAIIRDPAQDAPQGLAEFTTPAASAIHGTSAAPAASAAGAASAATVASATALAGATPPAADTPALCLAWQNDRLEAAALATNACGYGIDPLIATGLPANREPLWRHELACTAETWETFRATRRVLRLAELLGAGAQALALSATHAREREQFGKPIGANQAIKHRLADNWMALDNARLALEDACDHLDAAWERAAACATEAPGERQAVWPDARADAAAGVDAHTRVNAAARVADLIDADTESALLTASLLIPEAVRATTAQAIQTHGAMGITWECPIHFYLKRALHITAILARDGDESAILDRLWELG